MLRSGKTFSGSDSAEQVPLVVQEAYSGEAVHEYSFRDDKTTRPKKRPLRQHLHNARALFAEVFMPQGYPSTVSPDYLEYQRWDTLQAFASSQNGALATMAVLKGVGVGNEQATVLAAALTWLLKDGVGMIARIVFAWARGSRLDSDNKRWRLVADFLNDTSFMLELIASYLPLFCFTPIACFTALLRAIVDVSGRTTRMAVMRHQARRDNLADVAAKDGSQEMLVNVFSLLCSLMLLPVVEGHNLVIWTMFTVFTYIHLYANYRAAHSLQFDTLNQNRFQIAVRHFLKHGKAPTIQWCNHEEPILTRISSGLRHLRLGCQLNEFPAGVNLTSLLTRKSGEGENGLAWKWVGAGKVLCVIERKEGHAWMAIEEAATNEEMFDAFFAIEHYGEGKGWPVDSLIAEFRHQMDAQGWSLQTNQLNIDEWRFSHVTSNGIAKKDH